MSKTCQMTLMWAWSWSLDVRMRTAGQRGPSKLKLSLKAEPFQLLDRRSGRFEMRSDEVLLYYVFYLFIYFFVLSKI